MRRLTVRADASHRIGLGHVMRTLAIAEEALSRGLTVTYACVDDPSLTVLAPFDVAVQRLAGVDDRSWLHRLGPRDVVVLDGYHLVAELDRAVRDTGARLAIVDDRPVRVEADVLVASVASATSSVSSAVCLRGPEAALVRREFRNRRRPRTSAGVVVVMMGGTDVEALTPAVSATARATPGVRETIAVLGPGVASQPMDDGVTLLRSPSNLAAALDRASLAVVTASTVAWELLAMGIPLVLVEVAENQRPVATAIESLGLGWSVGSPDAGLSARVMAALQRASDPAVLRRASELALLRVDGRGAERVIEALLR
jgi:UDP-2,4-diacetamido-2,4,6-trideoxy-beta-L-altropyranose hydrolase